MVCKKEEGLNVVAASVSSVGLILPTSSSLRHMNRSRSAAEFFLPIRRYTFGLVGERRIPWSAGSATWLMISVAWRPLLRAHIVL